MIIPCIFKYINEFSTQFRITNVFSVICPIMDKMRPASQPSWCDYLLHFQIYIDILRVIHASVLFSTIYPDRQQRPFPTTLVFINIQALNVQKKFFFHFLRARINRRSRNILISIGDAPARSLRKLRMEDPWGERKAPGYHGGSQGEGHTQRHSTTFFLTPYYCKRQRCSCQDHKPVLEATKCCWGGTAGT